MLVAPERGLLEALRARLGRQNVVTLDREPRPGVQICGLIDGLPVRPRSFEIIVCNHVLEHVANDNRALREFYRLLKCGGRLYLTVPVREGATREGEHFYSDDQRFGEYRGDGHVRLYGRDLSERLAKCGFRAMVLEPEELLTTEERDEMGLNESEPIFVGERQSDGEGMGCEEWAQSAGPRR